MGWDRTNHAMLGDQRRGPSIPLTKSDVSAWRRLMQRTKRALDEPGFPMGDLISATRLARKARLPFPPISWENSFARLTVSAAAFAAMTDIERYVSAPYLREDFERCLGSWPDVMTATWSAPARLRKDNRATSTSWQRRRDIGDDDCNP